MHFYNYLREGPDAIILEGFPLLQEIFVVHVSISEKKIYLDGDSECHSITTISVPIMIRGQTRVCEDSRFRYLVERYSLYDKPFFLLKNKLYAVSSFPIREDRI